MTTLRVWVFGCSHEAADKAKGRDSLRESIVHSLLPAFGGWDIAISLGDHGGTEPPSEKTGRDTAAQFLEAGAKRHAIYRARGNHDVDAPGEPDGWWFNHFVDPLGQNIEYSGVKVSQRPFPVTGTWDKQSIQVGNLEFLLMSALTRPGYNLRRLGGDPGGWIPQETFDWWQARCAANRTGSGMVITCSHYLPKDTTLGTGEYEGGTVGADGIYQTVYHGAGYNPKWSGCVCCIGSNEGSTAFVDHLSQYPGDSAMWLGAHTHAQPGTTVNGRELRTEIAGCQFINCAALTKHHGNANLQFPRSRVFEFTDGSDQVVMRNWYHDTSYAPQVGYFGNAVTMTLPKVVML